ncbi:unnamed protein product [Rotaria sp. Silwood2]|nr:unnamed protein product [Rotaria sp. Silwood2]CAF4130904.1 unnamed protein product [Rotaria sp. Silwood2]
MSLPSAFLNPCQIITEDKVRNLLLRKQYMTLTELIQYFLRKTSNLQTEEIKDGVVKKIINNFKTLKYRRKTYQ